MEVSRLKEASVEINHLLPKDFGLYIWEWTNVGLILSRPNIPPMEPVTYPLLFGKSLKEPEIFASKGKVGLCIITKT
jgi:hypothetical protein